MYNTNKLKLSLPQLFSNARRRNNVVQDSQLKQSATENRAPISITVRQVAEPTEAVIVTVCGNIDNRCYRLFMERCEQLRAAGSDRLILDLRQMSQVKLSFLYALHCLAKIFRDEAYPGPEYGLPGMSRLAKENLAAGLHPRVKLLVTDGNAADILIKSNIHQIFALCRTEKDALRALHS